MSSDDWVKSADVLFQKIKSWIIALSPYKKAGLIIGAGVGFLGHSPIGGLVLGFGVAYLYEYISSKSSD